MEKNYIFYEGNYVYKTNYIIIYSRKIKGRKTLIYDIFSLKEKVPDVTSIFTDVHLGQIKWYGAWRKYCFFPNKETIWDNKCLEQIIDFLNTINKKKDGEK